MESPDLPLDMIYEILSATSLRTLRRCAVVCKNWNRMVYESSFIHSFCQRTKTISGFFIQSRLGCDTYPTFVSNNGMILQVSDSNLSLNFLPRCVKIRAATKQGIFLCVNFMYVSIPEYYVCKPSTKEWHRIPNPKTRDFTERLAIVVLRSQPLHYKIVRLSKPSWPFVTYNSEYYQCLYCEIFDSETWSWKQLQDVLLPEGVYLGNDPALSACGVLHWLLTNNEVLAFNKDTESWTTFDLPFPLDTKLMEYNGHLAALLCTEDEHGGQFAQLWVMVDYESKVWMKRHRISNEPFQEVERHSCPAAMVCSDIIGLRGFYTLIYYNFRTAQYSRCSVRCSVPIASNMDVFPFLSDLEPAYLKN